MDKQQSYCAFISYRHQSPDQDVAKALHTAIESYGIPALIKKQTGRKKLGKVFRDQEEHPLLVDLGADIEAALDASEWFIAICSPRYLESKWCLRELAYFIEHKGREHVLTVLVDGEPKDSFADVFRYVKNDGSVTEVEPPAEVCEPTMAGKFKKLKTEKLRILAPMLGVSFDDLKRRVRQRRLRIAAIVGATALFAEAALGILLTVNHAHKAGNDLCVMTGNGQKLFEKECFISDAQIEDAYSKIDDSLAVIDDSVGDSLDVHPEVTAAVQDGSLTAKFTYALKRKKIDDYVTPEMFGAVGDGVTDDTDAVQYAVNSGKIVCGHGKTYKVSNVKITHDCSVCDCEFYRESMSGTGSIEGYAFIADADDLNISFKDCTFRSANDRQTVTTYVDGFTSNVCFFFSSHSLSSAMFNRCRFLNAYYTVYIKAGTLKKFRCSDCECIGHVMGLDIAYCSDAVIENTRFAQNSNATNQAHDLYIAEGTGNKALIKNCEFNSVGPSIHGYHGSGYDLCIVDSRIICASRNPIVAVGTAQNPSKVYCKGCYIHTPQQICDVTAVTDFTFESCHIVATEADTALVTKTSSSSTQVGTATFNRCVIEGKCLTYTFGATFNECVITLDAGASRIIDSANTSLYGCKCVYTCSNAEPIKASGDCKFFNNYMENTELTNKTVYAMNTGNIFKGNVFVNCPQSYVGDPDMADNIFM